MKGQGAGGLSVSKGMPNTVSVPNDGTTDPSHQTDTGCVATEQASEQGAPCVLNVRCALRHCPSRTAFIRTVYKTFGKTTPAPSFLERPRWWETTGEHGPDQHCDTVAEPGTGPRAICVVGESTASLPITTGRSPRNKIKQTEMLLTLTMWSNWARNRALTCYAERCVCEALGFSARVLLSRIDQKQKGKEPALSPNYH